MSLIWLKINLPVELTPFENSNLVWHSELKRAVNLNIGWHGNWRAVEEDTLYQWTQTWSGFTKSQLYPSPPPQLWSTPLTCDLPLVAQSGLTISTSPDPLPTHFSTDLPPLSYLGGPWESGLTCIFSVFLPESLDNTCWVSYSWNKGN